MTRVFQPRLGLTRLREGPPRWVVATVKFCLVGLLMLPFTTAAWLIACSLWPAATTEMAPAAFTATVAVAVSTFACVMVLIRHYPPVRGDDDPPHGGR